MSPFGTSVGSSVSGGGSFGRNGTWYFTSRTCPVWVDVAAVADPPTHARLLRRLLRALQMGQRCGRGLQRCQPRPLFRGRWRAARAESVDLRPHQRLVFAQVAPRQLQDVAAKVCLEAAVDGQVGELGPAVNAGVPQAGVRV